MRTRQHDIPATVRTAVGLGGSDRIGSLTGNEWGDISFYVDNQIPVWVPIWDQAGGNGADGWYHIVGFGAILLTGDNEHAKWLEEAGFVQVDVHWMLAGHAVFSAQKPAGP